MSTEDGSDMDFSDDSFDDYYNQEEKFAPSKTDPENFVFECLTVEDVDRLLNERVEELSNAVHITPSLAKFLLHSHAWSVPDIIAQYRADSAKLLILSRLKPAFTLPKLLPNYACSVCITPQRVDRLSSLACGHFFCNDCWISYLHVQITEGNSIGIQCMANDCNILAPEDFILSLLTHSSMRDKYLQFAFRQYVKSHPQLCFCPGPNCEIIVQAKEPSAKRVLCSVCQTVFCFDCGMPYHTPTDCSTIKKWLTKCADDSETANYICVNTKDCPKCRICIEKNGGCNHMLCYSCSHEFCWMCLGDWKKHGSEYYECSRYRATTDVTQAREALKKYLHYYERWENHANSLKLEQQTLERIKSRINRKVMNAVGTWIDWQYLIDAANLLSKCRYTLQYTYPYAYYMEPGPKKELFEYQQAQLEAEIENLSWKIERAEVTARGDLENQMDIAEKRRATLLNDFVDSN